MTNHFLPCAKNIVSRIASDVLNAQHVLPLIYKEIDIHDLTHEFSKVRHNLLVIGRTRVYLINATTCHPDHFIGTYREISLKPGLRDVSKWARLHDFVLRFATPGSLITTYLLRGT